MMTTAAGVAPQWRRFQRHLDEARGSANSDDPHQFPDAVAGCLHEIYDLWEAWKTRTKPPLQLMKQQDSHVLGDPAGRIVAALVFARGGQTHATVAFGTRLGFGTQPFGTSPFGIGGWFWQPYADTNPRYTDRNGWYAAHLANQLALPALETAFSWLAAQPELR